MAQKDTSAKILEAKNDVFADIFNNLVFADRKDLKIDASQLEDEPTESFYMDWDGESRNMLRDVFKKCHSKTNQKLALVCLGIENETVVEWAMPIRVMGYAYTNYKKQLDAYNQERKALLKIKNSAKTKEEKEFIQAEIDKLGKFQLTPTLTVVLNFSDQKWNAPMTLKELTGDNQYAEIMQDFGITVINVKSLSKNTREHFTSDFKHVANIVCEGCVFNNAEVLDYPVETLDMIYAYTCDKRYQQIRNEIIFKASKGVNVTMKDFLDEIERKATITAERNKVIDCAKILFRDNIDLEAIINMIEDGLGVSKDEAMNIFNNEIQKSA